MKSSMKTYLFSGQGVQQIGMGKDLFARFPSEVAAADAVLGYSIEELCLRGDQRRIANTLYAQPAIHIVNCLSYLDLLRNAGPAPQYLAGHSVGELAALFAAGSFSFEDSVRVVQRRAELMARANGGGMLAVIGLSLQDVERTLLRNDLPSLDIANLNAPTQIVVSGPRQDILGAVRHFEDAGASAVVPLNVSAAFHSRYMSEAGKEFREFLRAVPVKPCEIPVIANVTGQPYEPGAIADTLASQLASPVRWCESIQRLMGIAGMEFVPLGWGNVIAGMLTRIRQEAKALEPPRTPTELSASIPEAGARTQEFRLGDPEFCRDHAVRAAYVCGAMYKGIASVDLVVRMARAGFLSFYGSGGQALNDVERAILAIRAELKNGEPFGMNLLASPDDARREEETVRTYLRHGITSVEAAAYMHVTPPLVKYRLSGLVEREGLLVATHRVLAKVSHPSVAEAFLRPAPSSLVQQLLAAGEITPRQAQLSQRVAMADDLCAEADSGGHTDRRNPLALLPSMLALRDRLEAEQQLAKRVRVGCAGGIGSPEAVAAAFVMAADFVLTGSINQCTVEAGTSDAVKDLLQTIDINDTTTCPSGDMFESGSQIQVVKKSVFFPARAQRLFELYQRHASLDELDAATRTQLEDKFFGQRLDEVYEQTRAYYLDADPKQVAKAEQDPRHKMALVFRAYFARTSRLAREGDSRHRVNFQIHSGPALGAFNQWARGGPLESWQARHADAIAVALMTQAQSILDRKDFRGGRSGVDAKAPAGLTVART
jgi:trans-AT polyketide synthase, acyltransferase and oxidoreductase domains